MPDTIALLSPVLAQAFDIRSIFFDGADGLIRVLLAAPVVYIAVIVFIRISGKRTTSQMNNFDWIVTVAMGSMIASPILLDTVPVVDALSGIALLLLMQFVVTKLSIETSAVERLVKAPPALLVHDGVLIRETMKAERVTEAEVLASIRNSGLVDLSQVKAVILESDARLSVISTDSCEDCASPGALSRWEKGA